jgi:hypothetical protein
LNKEAVTTTVYVPLLHEGVEVYRPTEGIPIDDMIYKLLPTPDYDAADEEWEFTPGSIVRCVMQVLRGDFGVEHECLVAKELVP